jgi:hypothetical protein
MQLYAYNQRTERYFAKTLHKTLGKKQPHAFSKREALKTKETGE